MVDDVSIIEHLKEYRAQAREMHANMNVILRGELYFDSEKLCFDPKEDELL